LQTVIAEGNIRRNPGVGALPCDTGEYAEAAFRQIGCKWSFVNGKNSGEWWGISLQLVFEGFELLLSGDRSDENSGTGVTDSAGDLETSREVVHKGAKADSLDNALDQQFNPFAVMLFCA
jgi:hypothetical protein